ncbi:MAG: asparagine synthase (glutamine-hydrolyzing) [Gammaproteobacteria bacterium]|nr:asparagine synthase (glutamine-hydrolyzing) [Gammaproteobacteria bacterium]
MCGIAGILYSESQINHEDFSSLVKAMGDTLAHRGPDDSGEWVSAEDGIGLAHRRLSIIDLSPAGHQPMISNSGRYVLVFNGEIYNFKEIRANLEKNGIPFKGHSDTETLLESIAYIGLDKTLEQLNGMFAFALWDKEQQSLTLARDRVGKKPLYYGWCNGTFLFGSELKALKEHPDFDNEIDRAALGQFIQYSWLNGPASIYNKINKLSPGSYIRIFQSDTIESLEPTIYWSALESAIHGQGSLFSSSYLDAVDQLEELLLGSVDRRMIADVELGALLSGGIDSSLIVSMMQAQTSKKVKTFSIGFHEESHNEAIHAKKIAQYLGTQHTEMYVAPKDCMDVIPLLPEIYDEPFGDVSQIPTYLVSKLANEKVKVVLSGDGGDELFAGYTRYFRCLDHWKKHELVPMSIRPFIGGSMDLAAKSLWYLLANSKTDQGVKGWRRFGAKLEKRARRIDAKSSTELFVRMMARYKNISDIVIEGNDTTSMFSKKNTWPNHSDPILNMMLIDTMCYLPDDILVKVDRASMATSLEARSPLLDKTIMEFSWKIPMSMKVDQFGGKRILKDVLARYVPRELTDRKKMGFGVPIGRWVRGPLQDWAEDLLEPSKVNQQGYFNESAVQRIWKQHKSGWRNHDDIIWSILMFQAWLDKR